MSKKSIIDEQNLTPTRLETLVDAVFAIAMTILVLELHVPEIGNVGNAHELWLGLVSIWPSVFSFVVSFVILGMFWVGHHTEFHYIKKLDNKLIWLNIFYMLMVSFLPFTAALLGRYSYNQTAVIIYGAQLLAMVLLHYFMWRHAAGHKNLITQDLDARVNNLVNRLTFFAVVAYGLAIIISFFSLPIALLIYIVAPIPYIMGWIYKLA